MHEVHHLLPADLTDLHPTQMTVGLAEVAAKRAEWAGLKPKARERLLAAHWFPAILGPGDRYFIVDHHHLGIALHQEKVRQAWVMPLDDFSALDEETFWRLMEFKRWAHPYDDTGRRREYADIPQTLEGLGDDPYRSLAGFVRRAGGYAKDSAPYTEFLWADYFRRQVLLSSLALDGAPGPSRKVVEAAVALAHDPAARNLPGWSGTASPPATAASTAKTVTTKGAAKPKPKPVETTKMQAKAGRKAPR